MQKKIKILRAIKGVTQEEVANALGITLSTYCKKENGKRKFTLDEAYKLAQYFDCSIEGIFFDNSVNFMNT